MAVMADEETVGCLRFQPEMDQTVTRKQKSQPVGWLSCLSFLRILVGRARFELATNGLKVRCSTD